VPEQLYRAAAGWATCGGSAEGSETSQNSILRRFLGRDSARPLRTGRRGGFSRRSTAGEQRIAAIGTGSILPARGGRGLDGVSG
jgi:hypothetical protein